MDTDGFAASIEATAPGPPPAVGVNSYLMRFASQASRYLDIRDLALEQMQVALDIGNDAIVEAKTLLAQSTDRALPAKQRAALLKQIMLFSQQMMRGHAVLMQSMPKEDPAFRELADAAKRGLSPAVAEHVRSEVAGVDPESFGRP